MWGGVQLLFHLIRRAIAREELVPDLQPPGVRERAENRRTTRIMSSLGRTAAPSTRFLAWPAKRVPCLWVRRNAVVRGMRISPEMGHLFRAKWATCFAPNGPPPEEALRATA